MPSRAKGWTKCGCYVWRTRKPSSFFGISSRWLALLGACFALALLVNGFGWWALLGVLAPLFSGRHTAYVGQTGNRYYRDNQHRFGDSRYGAPGKSWSDLEPRVYPLPCLFPHIKLAREIQEKLYIFVLLPVYNGEWNTKNPRRIAKDKAQRQRWARDKTRQTTGGLIRINILPAMARVALLLAVFAGLVYTGWERWVA